MSDDGIKQPRRLTRQDLTVFTRAAEPEQPAKPHAYDYILSLKPNVEWNPSTQNPYSLEGRSSFEEWRRDESLRLRTEAMMYHLSDENVGGYKVRRTENAVEFVFSSLKDCNLARMAFLNEGTYTVSLSAQATNMPYGQIRKMTHRLHEEYNRMGHNIRFHIDRQTKQITAVLRSRRAYVDFLGDEHPVMDPQKIQP